MWYWVFVLTFFFLIYVYRKKSQRKGQPPELWSLRILRNLRWVIFRWLWIRSWKNLVSYFAEIFGPVFMVNIMGQKEVFSSGNKAVKQVLTCKTTQGRGLTKLFSLIYKENGGIIFQNGEKCMQKKSLCLRLLRDLGFGKSSMEPTVMEEVSNFVKHLEKKTKEFSTEGIPMEHIFQAPVLNCLWRIVGGHTFSYEDPSLQKMLHAFQEAEVAQNRSGFILNYFPKLRYFAPKLIGYRSLQKWRSTIMTYVEQLVAEHRKTYKNDSERDFIDALFSAIETEGQKLTGSVYNMTNNMFISLHIESIPLTENSNAEICDILLDLYNAGLGTISNILSFFTLYLILYPDIQRKIQKEIDHVIGHEDKPTLTHIERMPYVRATILELLRITSIAPLVPRLAAEETNILGYRIPKGTPIWVNIYSVHMDKGHWRDPENFRPERFMDGEEIHKDWMFPFGGGRRRCLGENVARMILFLFISSLLQKFSFHTPLGGTPPSREPVDGFTTSPKPFRAVLAKRH